MTLLCQINVHHNGEKEAMILTSLRLNSKEYLLTEVKYQKKIKFRTKREKNTHAQSLMENKHEGSDRSRHRRKLIGANIWMTA